MQNAVTNQVQSKTLYIEKFLYPGELYIAIEPTNLWTILGSCVSIVLYSPRKRISAICHAQLAEKMINKERCSDTCPCPCNKTQVDSDFKYVTCSIHYMVDQFLKMGIYSHEMQVSLYGGANVLKSNAEVLYKIGDNNIKVAYKMIEKYGLHLSKSNVGGDQGRVLRLISDTGITDVKFN